MPKERIRLVANRYGQRGQVAWKQAQEAIGESFATWVYDDSRKANLALNQGQPMVKLGRYSATSRRFYKLAELLNGRPK